MRPAAVAAFTLLALACFAANSLLCRLALGRGNIDPARFTAIRVIAGALTLWLVSRLRARAPARRTWRAPLALFAYASAFSFAYASLGAATGALVLFGSVQITMLIAAMRSGEIGRAHV
jgi:drug/metabolite transporter (DMT)-like permease